MKYCFGIDIGGTTVKIGLFSDEKNLIDKWEIETVTDNSGERILPDISKSVIECLNKHNITKENVLGLGVGVPAATYNGVVESTTNIGWGYKNVQKELEELTNIKTIVENDANLAALGELNYGSGKGYRNAVMVTLGTGVGGGIIVNGNIYSGFNGYAGEIGEIIINDTSFDGEKHNLEFYASATGIKRLAEKKIITSNKKTILSFESVNAKEVFDAVKKGDILAIEIAEEFGTHLGQALTDLSFILAPEIFIIGGGVSKAGNVLLDYIKKSYSSNISKIYLASLQNDAGIFGASALILNNALI